MVVVDVVATDNKDLPVKDLKADDFIVQEEGQAQAVRAFSFHQTEQEPASASAQASAFVNPKLPLGYFSNAPSYKSNGALNVLLLDALNSTLLNQATMRDAMIKLMEKLPAGQPMAVYLLGNKLTLVQDFTSDPEVLKKAIAGVKRQGSKLLDNAAGTTRMDDMPAGSVMVATMMDVPHIKNQLERFHDQQMAAQADSRVPLTLDALNSLGRYLAGYPGRKNLVWVSETTKLLRRIIAISPARLPPQAACSAMPRLQFIRWMRRRLEVIPISVSAKTPTLSETPLRSRLL
jgi:VWFA-related protein